MIASNLPIIHFGAFVLSVYGFREFFHEVSLHLAAKEKWWPSLR